MCPNRSRLLGFESIAPVPKTRSILPHDPRPPPNSSTRTGLPPTLWSQTRSTYAGLAIQSDTNDPVFKARNRVHPSDSGQYKTIIVVAFSGAAQFRDAIAGKLRNACAVFGNEMHSCQKPCCCQERSLRKAVFDARHARWWSYGWAGS
eukprot:686532-Pleurochrysis_carterae.AAC.2